MTTLDVPVRNIVGDIDKPRGGALVALARHSVALARRSLIKTIRTPEALIDVTLQPVIFLLLFTYLLGGAISGGDRAGYLQFLLPGTLVLAVVFLTVYSGVNVNSDLSTGTADRYRSLPISRSALIVGGLIGDLGRYLLAAGLVIGLGLLMGYRAGGGVVGVLAAGALVIVFASALSWAWTALGLMLRTPTAVMNLGFVLLFPLTFLSNVFVAPATMPDWLRQVANANPISHLVTAARALMDGTAAGHDVFVVLATSAGLVVVLAPITVVLYQRRQ